MEQTQAKSENGSARTYWLLFLISFVLQVLLFIYLIEFFWLALPFVLAFLVRAMGKM